VTHDVPPSNPTTPSGSCAADAGRVLTGWAPPDADQAEMRDRFLAFLDAHGAAAVDRDLRAGHLTASTVLLDHSRTRTLLTLHGLIGQWVQLGGHVEPGEMTLAAAALREATEESGIPGIALDPTPLGLDWHSVSCRDSLRRQGPSEHLDVTYLAVAPPGAVHLRSDESLDLAWFDIDALPAGADAVVRSLVARAQGRIRG
jgi:8-oxo-dGTP pyrophosphatase MutT (NUDIX family)